MAAMAQLESVYASLGRDRAALSVISGWYLATVLALPPRERSLFVILLGLNLGRVCNSLVPNDSSQNGQERIGG